MPSDLSLRDNYDGFQLYRYTPSFIAAIIVASLFLIASIAHTYRLVRLQARFFVPFIVGLLFETIGYAGRAWSHYDKEALAPYIMQAILILVAPALFAASLYIVLGRIIRALDGGEYSLIPLRWLTRIFVAGDVVSFLTQMVGGGIQAAGTLELLQIGEKLIIVGLFIQIAMFGFFIAVAVTFQAKWARHSRSMVSKSTAKCGAPSMWKRRSHPIMHLHVLYITSGLIMVRSVFRVIEYLQGHAGYLLSNEIWLYMFDALLMLFIPMIVYVVHPGLITNMALMETGTMSQASTYEMMVAEE